MLSPSSSSVFHVVVATTNKPSWPPGRLRSSDTDTQTQTETHQHLSALSAVRDEHKLLITANLTGVLSALKFNHCGIVWETRNVCQVKFRARLVFVLYDLLFGSFFL